MRLLKSTDFTLLLFTPFLVLLLSHFFVTPSYAENELKGLAYVNTRAFNNNSAEIYASDIAFDSDNNVYLLGELQGDTTPTVDLDWGFGTSTTETGTFFFAKYSASGEYLWGYTLGDFESGREVNPTDVVVDANDNVYVLGDFRGSVDFNFTASSDIHSAGESSYATFLTKIDPDGSYLWTKTWGAAYSYELAIDNTRGVMYTVGNAATGADLDPGAGSASAVFLTYLFNIFSAGKDSYLTTLQLISPVFAFTRLKKKSQNYGVVYDSITKEPISQAIIRITDTGGRLITTVVTDVYGIFDINLESGSYKFEVEANGYTFPSRTIQTSVDEPYRNVYLGGMIEHSSQNALNISIPMDKVDSRFIEESAASAKNILGTAWNIVITLFFVLGLVTSVMAIINNPTTLAWVVLCVYILFVVIFVFIRIRNSKKFGYVRSTDGTLLSGLEIGLVEQEFDQLYAKRVTDNEGKYRFILPGGKYKLVVLNPEFKLVNMEKDIFEVKEGSVLVLKEDLIVRKV